MRPQLPRTLPTKRTLFWTRFRCRVYPRRLSPLSLFRCTLLLRTVRMAQSTTANPTKSRWTTRSRRCKPLHAFRNKVSTARSSERFSARKTASPSIWKKGRYTSSILCMFCLCVLLHNFDTLYVLLLHCYTSSMLCMFCSCALLHLRVIIYIL
jgi:hypothetical protein